MKQMSFAKLYFVKQLGTIRLIHWYYQFTKTCWKMSSYLWLLLLISISNSMDLSLSKFLETPGMLQSVGSQRVGQNNNYWSGLRSPNLLLLLTGNNSLELWPLLVLRKPIMVNSQGCTSGRALHVLHWTSETWLSTASKYYLLHGLQLIGNFYLG